MGFKRRQIRMIASVLLVGILLALSFRPQSAVSAQTSDSPYASSQVTACAPFNNSLITPLSGSPNELLQQGITLRENEDPMAALNALLGAAAGFEAAGEDTSLAHAHIETGLAYYALCEYQQARTIFDRALAIYNNRVKNDPLGYARAYHHYARAQEKLGARENALTFFRLALRKATEANDTAELASIHRDWGDFYYVVLDYRNATTEYTAAVELFSLVPDKLSQAYMLFKLADTYLLQWNLDFARRNYQEAIDIFHSLNLPVQEAQTYRRLAYTYHHTDDWYAAMPIYETALGLFQAGQNPVGAARVQADIGDLLHQIGFLDEARFALDTALQESRANGDQLGEWMTLVYQGDLLLTERNPGEAISKYNQISQNAPQDILLEVYLGLARAELARGIYLEAFDHVNAALTQARALKDPYSESRVWMTFAWIEYLDPKSNATMSYLSRAQTAATSARHARGEINVLLEKARYQFYLLQYSNVATTYNQALSLVEGLNDPLLQGYLYLKAGDLKELRSDYQGAIGDYSAAETLFTSMSGPLVDEQKDVMLGYVLGRRAYIFYLQGQYGDAVDTAEASLTRIDELTAAYRNEALIRHVTGFSHFVLGQVYLDLELWADASSHLNDAQTNLDGPNDMGYLAWVYSVQGHLAYQQMDDSEASSAYNLADGLLKTIERQPIRGRETAYYRARGQWLIGAANLITRKVARSNEPSEANLLELQTTYESVITHYRSYGDVRSEREAYLHIAELYLLRKTLNKATEWAGNALNKARGSGDVFGQGLALFLQGQILIQQNTGASTIEAKFQSAADMLEMANVPSRLIPVYEELGAYELAHAQLEKAFNAFTKMLEVARADEDWVEAASAHISLGQVYEAQRRYEDASENYEFAECLLELIPQTPHECAAAPDDRHRFYNPEKSERQQIILYAVWTLHDLYLEQISNAQAHAQALQNQINISASMPNDISMVRALLAQGEYLLVADRNPQAARSQFDNAQRLAAQLVLGEELEARAFLGSARTYTAEALIEARVSGDSAALTDGSNEANAYDSALKKARSNPRLEQEVYLAWGTAYMQRNIFVDTRFNHNAQSLFSTAAKKAAESRPRDWLGHGYALLSLGDMYLRMEDIASAKQNFLAAMKSFETIEDYVGQGEALARLGHIALEQAYFEEASNHYTTMLNLYRGNNDHVREAYAHMLFGELAIAQTQYPLAEQNYLNARSAINVARTESPLPTTPINCHVLASDDRASPVFSVSQNPLADQYEIEILLNLSAFYLITGEYAKADTYISNAEGIASFIADPFIVARVCRQRGLWMLKATDSSNAPDVILIFDYVIGIYEKYADTRRLIEAYIDLGGAYHRNAVSLIKPSTTTQSQNEFNVIRSNYISARESYGKALNAARSSGILSLIALSQYHYGVESILVGQKLDGEAQLKEGLKNAAQANDSALQAVIYTALGIENEQSFFQTQDRAYFDEAILNYERAIPLIENTHTDIGVETGQVEYFINNLTPYHRLVTLLASSDPELALEYAERSRARTFLFQFLSEQVLLADDGQGTYEQWSDLSIDRRKLHYGIDDTKRIEALDRQIKELESQLIADNQLFRQIARVEVSTLDAIQESLAPRTAMLVYYILPVESAIEGSSGTAFVFFITHDDFRMIPLGLEGDEGAQNSLIINDITNLKDKIDQYSEDKDRSEAAQQELVGYQTSLYARLIAPVGDYLEEIDHLVIVPHAELNTLSFSMLQRPDGEMLMQRFNLLYTPNASYYQLTASQDQPDDISNALLVGNPVIQEITMDGEVQILDSLNEDEVSEILHLFPGTEDNTERRATEKLIIDQGPFVDLIHISAHGIFDSNNSLDSFLALSGDDVNDGHLTVREIYRLPLRERAPLVVLSACDSASIKNGTDELQSLARAFLVAGADEVVATLWQVSEEATVALIVKFYELRTDGVDSATALKMAQAHVRNNPDANWSHPYFWAGFVLIGAQG